MKPSTCGFIFCKIATFIFVVFVVVNESQADLTVFTDWKYLDYDFDSAEQKNQWIQSGDYDFKENLLVDVDSSVAGDIFVTVLRKKGVPASLATLTKSSHDDAGGDLLKPYPDWSWTNISDCDHGLIGVHRIASDVCNRLWVLDSGNVNFGVSKDEIICPPKLLLFDMASRKLLWKDNIPNDLVYGDNGKSLFASITVHTAGDNCADTSVYMADVDGFGLVIWNNGEFSRFQSPYFAAEKKASTFDILDDESMYLEVGLFGMAVKDDHVAAIQRKLYFRPLSSYNVYQVAVSEFQTKKYDQKNIHYVKEPFELESQSGTQAFSYERKTVLFFTSVTNSSVFCWNTVKPWSPENTGIIAHDATTLQWPASLKITPKTEDTKETLWVVSYRLQRFINNDMNFNETNFRILVGNVNDLLRGTVCE